MIPAQVDIAASNQVALLHRHGITAWRQGVYLGRISHTSTPSFTVFSSNWAPINCKCLLGSATSEGFNGENFSSSTKANTSLYEWLNWSINAILNAVDKDLQSA